MNELPITLCGHPERSEGSYEDREGYAKVACVINLQSRDPSPSSRLGMTTFCALAV